MERIATPLIPQQGRNGKMEYFCTICGKATIVNSPVQGEGIKFAYIEITKDLGRLQFARVVQWLYPLPFDANDVEKAKDKVFVIVNQNALFSAELPNCPKLRVLIGRGTGSERVYMKHKDGVEAFPIENFKYLFFDKEGFLFTDKNKNAGVTCAYLDEEQDKVYWATNYSSSPHRLYHSKDYGSFLDNDDVEVVWTKEMEENHFVLQADLKNEVDRAYSRTKPDFNNPELDPQKPYVVVGELPKGNGVKTVKVADVNGLYVLLFI